MNIIHFCNISENLLLVSIELEKLGFIDNMLLTTIDNFERMNLKNASSLITFSENNEYNFAKCIQNFIKHQ